jgi:hypothetical protein
MALNVTTLISNILPPLHTDTAANAVFVSDGELTRFFDEAIKALARKFLVFVTRSTTAIDLAQGTALYNAPSRHICTLHLALIPDADLTDAVDLVPSSTTELEALDEAYATTQGTPGYWYSDRSGVNKIGFYPVPDAAAADDTTEIIYAEFPATLNEAHPGDDVPVPQCIADYLEAAVLRAAYGKESDFAMPETAAQLAELVKLDEQVINSLWGGAQ